MPSDPILTFSAGFFANARIDREPHGYADLVIEAWAADGKTTT
jgi:hypothetical protein